MYIYPIPFQHDINIILLPYKKPDFSNPYKKSGFANPFKNGYAACLCLIIKKEKKNTKNECAGT